MFCTPNTVFWSFSTSLVVFRSKCVISALFGLGENPQKSPSRWFSVVWRPFWPTFTWKICVRYVMLCTPNIVFWSFSTPLVVFGSICGISALFGLGEKPQKSPSTVGFGRLEAVLANIYLEDMSCYALPTQCSGHFRHPWSSFGRYASSLPCLDSGKILRSHRRGRSRSV